MRKELTFTAYRRPWYLREAIGSWNQAANILDWDVSMLLEPSIIEVENAMLAEFHRLECGFSVAVVNDHKLGVLRNPYAAFTSAFDAGNDFVVLAEDDIIVSNDVLEYFEWAMETYKEDQSVLAVLAFSRIALEDGEVSREAVSRTKVFCPLVWGTWQDRWESTIKPNWDLDYSSGKPDGSEAGWDWNMMRVAVREGKDFLYPQASRSNHIGRFGGEHTSHASFPESQAPTFKQFHGRTKDFEEKFLEDVRLYDYYPRPN